MGSTPAVVGTEARPEGKEALFLQQLSGAVSDALVLRPSCTQTQVDRKWIYKQIVIDFANQDMPLSLS